MRAYFGYKDNVKVDKDSKIITDFEVTTARGKMNLQLRGKVNFTPTVSRIFIGR
jgi:hypothetical protein